MNNLNDPLYVAAVLNARISERRGVALEELARDARQAGIGRRKRWSQSGLGRLVLAIWTRSRRPRTHRPLPEGLIRSRDPQ